MDVFTLIIAFLTLELVKVDGAVSSPEDIEGCVGEDITIPWSYDDVDTDITFVLWSVNGTTNIMTYFGSGGSRNPQGGYNVVAANNEGSINVTNAQRSNTGTYKIEISALVSSSDDVDLLVCEPASTSLDGSKGIDSVMQCNASDLGEPEAQLYIKVNGEAKSSSSALVTDSDKVECCISGCAATCIRRGSEYCTTVQTTSTSTSTTSTTTSTTTTRTTPTTTTFKPSTTLSTTYTMTSTTTPSTSSSTATTTTRRTILTTMTTTTSLSDEIIIVIVVVPVGVITTLIFVCLFYHLRRGKRKPASHKRHKHGRHYKGNMRPVQQHQQQPHIINGRSHTRELNQNDTKRSRSLHNDDRYNWYDRYHWGSQVKQIPAYMGDRNLSRLYNKESLPRYDGYRSGYTRGHVYPSNTSGYHYRPDYHGDSRGHGNRQHSSYPIYSTQQEYINPSYTYMEY